MSSYQAKDRAVTIRTPSVAQLYIDSADRINWETTTASAITIQKNQAMIPGFFNRVALTEFVLEWQTPNISGAFNNVAFQGNNVFSYGVGATSCNITMPTSFYTVEKTLNQMIVLMNATGLGGVTWTTSNTVNGSVYLVPSALGSNYRFDGKLMEQLGISSGSNYLPIVGGIGELIFNPDLRPCKYLDLVCPQLTYTQEVKDSSSQNITRDALARWYFSYNDTQTTSYDGLGFPILMGYKPFSIRRVFSPAKQIKWETGLPVAGSLDFMLYNETGNLQPTQTGLYEASFNTGYMLTLQVSED